MLESYQKLLDFTNLQKAENSEEANLEQKLSSNEDVDEENADEI